MAFFQLFFVHKIIMLRVKVIIIEIELSLILLCVIREAIKVVKNISYYKK